MRKRIIILLLVVVGAAVAGVVWTGRFGREDTHQNKLSGNIELTQVDI
jgi:hypothetical protein